MLIYPKNNELARIIGLLSAKSFCELERRIEKHLIVKTTFKVEINNFTFLCALLSNDLAVIMAFRYKRPSYNYGNSDGIAEINIIENHFMDQNLQI